MKLSMEDADVEAIANRVATLLARNADRPTWMNADEAAEYLCAPVSRIRKLTSTGCLPSYKEGGRRLYRADEIDAFVLDGGASTH